MTRSGGAAPPALAIALSLALPGCHHLIEPIRPPAIPLDEIQAVSFPETAAVRLENGRPVPAVRRLRAEGIHELEVDLSDWSARLVSELAFELERRGVSVFVPEWAFAGTSVEPGRSRAVPDDLLSLAALRVRVTGVRAADPETGQGFHVGVEIASVREGFRAEYSAGEAARGFADALYDLKKKILDDGGFQAWLRAAGGGAEAAR